MENPIPRQVLERLYVTKRLAIRPIAKGLKRAEATVLRYLRLYKIERIPQHQWAGKKMSRTHRGNMIKAITGRKLNKSHRKKLSEVRRGQKRGGFKKRYVDPRGYIHLWMPDSPMALTNGYVKEHRHVMSQIIGRPLERSEIVHHLNEVKGDNRPENLELTTASEHSRRHKLNRNRIAKDPNAKS